MSPRHHLVLRFGAVAVLAAAWLWPSSRTPAQAAPRSAVRAVATAQAKRTERPRAAKIVIAEGDATHATH